MKKINKIKRIAKNYWNICLAIFLVMRFCFAVMLGSIVMFGVPFLVIIGLIWVYEQYSDNIQLWYKILLLVITMIAFRLCYKPGWWIINRIMGDKISNYKLDDYYIDHLD